MKTNSQKFLLVKPKVFYHNDETSHSNVFQTNNELNGVYTKSLREWNALCNKLINYGINIIIFDGVESSPDSIFPNWFTTYEDKTYDIFSMEALNRRTEKTDEVINFLDSKYKLKMNLTSFEEKKMYLEGTSSMVLDRKNKIAYSCLSSRTNLEMLNIWSSERGYKIKFFYAYYQNKPVYHTNVLMWIGDQIIGLSSSLIEENVLNELKSSFSEDSELILFDEHQIACFCGNMIQLNKGKDKYLLLSKTAHESLNKNQVTILNRFYDDLIIQDISTIEMIGGGSVRCMIQELF